MTLARRLTGLITVLIAAAVVAACGATVPAPGPAASASPDDPGPVVIYSGRNETLIAPVLQRLEAETGTRIQVRYGDSSALAAQILDEGDRSPADLFFSQDAGALGALAGAGRLARLDSRTIAAALPGYADREGRWVATSARARVIAYHPGLAPEAATMTGIDEILDPRYRGKTGYAPTNASFHAFVTALRVTRGEAEAERWLLRFRDNQPKAYDKNAAVLAAVDSGQISLGLINHYYWHELANERGADKVTARVRFLGTDDPGALINVAGVGIVASTARPAATAKVVDALLAETTQRYFAEHTAEYPVVAGVPSPPGLPALADLKGSRIDLNQLASLPQTLAMLDRVGLT